MLHEGWAVVCVSAFWGWIAVTAGFIVASFPGKDIFNARPARLWGTSVVVLYALWMLAMTQA